MLSIPTLSLFLTLFLLSLLYATLPAFVNAASAAFAVSATAAAVVLDGCCSFWAAALFYFAISCITSTAFSNAFAASSNVSAAFPALGAPVFSHWLENNKTSIQGRREKHLDRHKLCNCLYLIYV